MTITLKLTAQQADDLGAILEAGERDLASIAEEDCDPLQYKQIQMALKVVDQIEAKLETARTRAAKRHRAALVAALTKGA
jgi:hypothetical protein